MKHYALAALMAAAATSCAEEPLMESVGARFGFSGTKNAHDFHQAETFGNLNLPWHWDLGPKWFMQTRLDLSAGWLGDPGGDAFIGTVGPSLLLGRESFPLSLEGGLSPTVLSRDKFREKDFGMPFQFTSHIGLNWDLGEHWRLGYRFQHMSNAGFACHNPGLNLHALAASYLF